MFLLLLLNSYELLRFFFLLRQIKKSPKIADRNGEGN